MFSLFYRLYFDTVRTPTDAHRVASILMSTFIFTLASEEHQDQFPVARRPVAIKKQSFKKGEAGVAIGCADLPMPSDTRGYKRSRVCAGEFAANIQKDL